MTQEYSVYGKWARDEYLNERLREALYSPTLLEAMDLVGKMQDAGTPEEEIFDVLIAAILIVTEAGLDFKKAADLVQEKMNALDDHFWRLHASYQLANDDYDPQE